ncbi:MAG: hypothetical protein IPI02_02145 [Sterolibacteriaceae bacterium]|nr:hypothetical protein [Sterolibacteriaceae bacterium]
MIEAVAAPPTLSIPSPSEFKVTAQALPAGVPGRAPSPLPLACSGHRHRIAVAPPKAMFWGIVIGAIGWIIAGSAGSSERTAERSRRSTAQQAAKKEYDELVERVQRDAGPAGFQAKRAELSKLRNEYQALPQAERQELDHLHSTAHERQQQKFLDTCFIDSASISGVGPARKAALRSFGIETAADVSRSKVMQVRGFGEGLTRAMTDWKACCERRFVFNASNAVSAADRDAVRSKFGARKVSIEAALTRGAGELQNFRQRATSQMAMLKPQLEASARKLAQAEKDLSAL